MTSELLWIGHCQSYPLLELRDLFKFLHQSAFGCGHMVSSCEQAVRGIKDEAAAMTDGSPSGVEPLDGDYCRVPLILLSQGLSPDTLGKLFFLSAREEKGGREALEHKLTLCEALISEGKLPFALDDFRREREVWAQNGYGALRHSNTFRTAYRPAYRVLHKEYAVFLPLFAAIDRALSSEKEGVTLAIEGGSASGKSTLADRLAQVYGCTVLHMDDFFLRPGQRTAERLAEVGGNVDRERFREEVLYPLSRRETISYRRFDCSSQTVRGPLFLKPTRLTVVEGAYSLHPELSAFYDLSLFLDVPPAVQKERILKRNGEAMAKRFFDEWIPMERVYFEKTDIKKRCGLTVSVE